MSKRKRLEEGLADLFSSRLEGDPIEVEEEFSMDELAAEEPVEDGELEWAASPEAADGEVEGETSSAAGEAESGTQAAGTAAVEAPVEEGGSRMQFSEPTPAEEPAAEDSEPVSDAPTEYRQVFTIHKNGFHAMKGSTCR